MKRKRQPRHLGCYEGLIAPLLAGALLLGSSPVRAADILRAGRVATGTPGASADPAAAAAPLVNSAGHAHAVDVLARTTQALQAVQSMQAAARSLAASGPNHLGADPNHPGQTLPTVPDGLVNGGLKPIDVSAWLGAAAPTQSASGGRTNVTVAQSASQALLTWETFNVGRNTTLTFDQSQAGADASTWIAFNQIRDPSGVPSQILGSIQAAGQVFVLNQNGIIFGGASQVNTHALVASSLPINSSLVTRGLLNNPDQQFLFSTLPINAGANGTPAFTPPAALTPNGQSGDVVVQAGAQLSSPTTPEHVGGRIALFGPNVTNAGTISTPDGQTMLAAGRQIGLAAHDGSDPTLRGLDVFVGEGGGTVTNAAGALIDAPRASVTLAGRAINQLGAIASTTSVAFNGRIDLLAEYDAVSNGGFAGLVPFFPQTTGTVFFGERSVTQIMPELASAERVVGLQLALASRMNVRGQSVYLGPRASLLAPSATLTIDAGNWNLVGAGATAQDFFTYTTGQIYLDTDAAIDVSGSANVAASVQENIVSVELRGAELANAPLQREGPLRGQTVQVDIRQTGSYQGRSWVGTPLADTTGYVALVDRTAGELTTNGGQVKLSAGNAVVMQPGAAVNVSGGWIDYAGGFVETTRLLADGHVIDIAQATPDRVYDGIYTGAVTSTDPKWGVTSTVTNPDLARTFEAGYVQGGAGGALAITAPSVALDGKLLGSTVAGTRQRTAPPAASSLALVLKSQDLGLPQNLYPFYSPVPPTVTFENGIALAHVGEYSTAGTTLPEERKRRVVLSPTLLGADAFGLLRVDNSDGDIRVPAGVAMTGPATGGLTLLGANIDIQGQVNAPGGTLSFTAYDRSPYADRALTGGALPPPPQADLTRGRFTLGNAARLDVTGLVVDDRAGPAETPLITKAGSIAITGFTADLAAGGSLDASGGLAISTSGKIMYGDGGSLAIKAGQDPVIPSLLGGSLNLGATLAGYSGAKGGTLMLLAPSVQIGGTASVAGTLALAPEFFQQGGFTNFSVNGIGGRTTQAGVFTPAVVVAPGTAIAPVTTSRVVASEAEGKIALAMQVQPAGVRPAANLSLGAPGARDPFNPANPIAVRGDLVFGDGASIQVDPKGSVTLSGDTISVQGRITAPGGSIRISGAKDSALLFDDVSQAQVTTELGARSVLSTAGTTVLVPDPRGLRTGAVLGGGNIDIGGNIAARAGATLDVSGASGTLDLAPSVAAADGASLGSLTGALAVPTAIASDGGSIVFAGGQALFLDATLTGAAGGPAGQGGSVDISSGRFFPPGSGSAQTPLDVTLTVTQAAANIPGRSGIGVPFRDAQGQPLAGQGYLAADTLNRGGFDVLTLKGTVQFSGPVTLNAARSLTLGTSGIVFADGAVALNAAYIDLGSAFRTPLLDPEVGPAFLVQGQPFYAPAKPGAGSLTVNAALIDLGNLSLQTISRATFVADKGDIRGNGSLEIAGDVTLRAGQVYTPTAVDFTIAAIDYLQSGQAKTGSITIAASGSRQTPLSAGGSINLFGTTITQGGTLRAPLGTITLGWDGAGAAPRSLVSNLAVPATRQLTLATGSVTSVAAVDDTTGKPLVLPFGVNLNGTSWIDPASNDITVGGVPGKTVNVSAINVVEQTGAVIDLRGGGDLLAYRWIPGVGGSNDILAATNSFAILPTYNAGYAPFAPFNPTALNTNLGRDAGFVNPTLAVGDRIYLGATADLPAGVYTLLPARYALLPGACLVTPKPGVPPATGVQQPDGASVVGGYRFNGVTAVRAAPPLSSAYEIAPASVVMARAQYDESTANTFLAASAVAHDSAVPRLPIDAGQLVFNATQGMSLQGAVTAAAPAGGRGGLVDISSPIDIFIGSSSTAAPAGPLVLRAAELNAFGAQSLLIGGVRQTTAAGTTVTAKTGSLTLSNAGTPLTGADLILAANQSLRLAPGSAIEQSGTATGALDVVTVGDVATPGSGNGALVRVSNDVAARVQRAGVDTSAAPTLRVDAGARVNGTAVTLDSSSTTTLDPAATLSAQSLSLGSGQITLQLANAAPVSGGGGLVLSSAALAGLQNAQALSLLSYSTIDVRGSGQIGVVDSAGRPVRASLALRAAAIRGFETGGGTVTFAAKDLLLDNTVNALASGSVGPGSGTLAFVADTVRLGVNTLRLDNFSAVTIDAPAGLLMQAAGSLVAQGDLTLRAPRVTGLAGASGRVEASGALTLTGSSTNLTPVTGGLGATIGFTGSSLAVSNTLLAPSGTVTLRATGGGIAVGGTARIDVAGTTQVFHDLTKATDGGSIQLTAEAGAVTLAAGSVLTVAAPDGGAAGAIAINAPAGEFTNAGTLLGAGGAFALDVGSLPGAGLDRLNDVLNNGGFTLARSLRLRNGDAVIGGLVRANDFSLSADRGGITVGTAGAIDASGATGGSIALQASGPVVLESGARLTVAANNFNSAGKGGAIDLETRGSSGATIDLRAGAKLDLSVAATAATGDFSGTLHLRAPQSGGNSDVQIAPIGAAITGASSIVVEGFQQFTPGGFGEALITADVQQQVKANGTTFGGSATGIAGRLLASQRGLAAVLHIRPGAEIVNPAGDLTLASAWDFSTFRFGTGNEPGVLTLRAAGSLNFDYSYSPVFRVATIGLLSDGFGGVSDYGLWDAPLLAAGNPSWSYRLVAGADFTAADYQRVQPLTTLGGDSGSLRLGRNAPPIPLPANPNSPNSTSNLRQSVIPIYFQTIRTGTGDIDVRTARDVQFLNPLATIYTAGTQAEPLANFATPNLAEPIRNSKLGPVQAPTYPAQFSLGGGNVTLAAQRDITRLGFQNGELVADSSRELPTNWLYRRGHVDPSTGQFGPTHPGGEVASTAWWVDFSNFFADVAALGGGNVTLRAGRAVANISAAVPTNARLPGTQPIAANLVELGGGDLVVRAGGDIDGGVYYVERGLGTLSAGGRIKTNATRAALPQSDVVALENQRQVADPATWLPTTLFAGDSSFDVSARGDVLLGAVANPFLLPQGINNNAFEKSYFTTLTPEASVEVSSLTGALTLRASPDGRTGSLADWFTNVLRYDEARHQTFSSYSQPWLRVMETDIAPFLTATALMPGALRATAFSGELNLVGSLILSPAPQGTLELVAAKSINGFQPNGVNTSTRNRVWGSAVVNVSDADPRRLPGIATPMALSAAAATTVTPIDVLDSFNALFNESGSVAGLFGVIQTRQALHAAGPLHAGDTTPTRILSRTGDISGLTLYSPKATRLVAGRDVSDISLYLQNTRATDVSVVAAGRDLIAFNPNSPLRVAGQSAGNELLLSSVTTPGPGTGNATAGDIQIGGPGTLEVLAGRNFDLGVGGNVGDGTGIGVTSIGNARNPNLGFAGADIVAAAGVGAATSLGEGQLAFGTFEQKFLNPATAGDNAARYLPEVRALLGLTAASDTQTWTAYTALAPDRRARVALDAFYRVLRDAGRDHGKPSSPGFRNYDTGFAAIAALFPGPTWRGDISLTSREIKTASGGDIRLIAPGGELNVGLNVSGAAAIDQGVLTETGGGISIFTRNSVNVGTSRIFTLRGGNEIIWSSAGNIAAGASSKTVQSAPPTRVLVDPQSGDVKTDLAGLATGGGIGVLATVAGVEPGDVDLIAPAGTIDAGDAGIRVSGNLNISALQVVNAANIQVSGASVGTPVVAAPNIGGLLAAAATSTANSSAASNVARQNQAQAQPERLPSIINVEVLGYGGGEGG